MISGPPAIPLPAPSESQSWYGELYLRYPLHSQLYPLQFGELFKAKAEFCVILNELVRRFFKAKEPSEDRPSVAGAAEFYSRFENWYRELPESISPRKAVLPGHLKLQ